MDPNKTLNEILDCILSRDWDDAMAALRDLEQWVERGGFAPEDPRKPTQALSKPRTEEREAFEKLEKLIEQLAWDGYFTLAERKDALEAADGMPLMVAVDLAKLFYKAMSRHAGMLEEVIELAKSGGHRDEN